MKKWWIGLLILAIIAILSVYIFIPSKQAVSSQVSINCVQIATERILLSKSKLSVWWPGTIDTNHSHKYKNFQYRFNKTLLNGIDAVVTNGKDSLTGMIQIIPTDGPTTLLQWSSPVTFSNNPLTRIRQYFNFVAYKKNIDDLFSGIKDRLEKQENIYGFKVIQQTVTDTIMVSIKQTLGNYPSTAEVYSMINSLQQFISLNKTKATGFPMLNVHDADSAKYEVMVAIPTETEVKSSEPYLLKEMIPGNILMAEVKGGIYTVREAEKQLVNYADDHKKVSPAIPYQSLITNRQLEPDTLKWITRLYYPVFI